jgi:uncharacterized protein YyaL (SSP411 family)
VAVVDDLDPIMADEIKQKNRLAAESSPYLLLHQTNPVDWYPWGAEALERARREDRPVFLSVGYSTCYWCHVMERESFTDPAIAELMNRSFINVKLDREERPELDEIYMTATQLLTRHGGWPNSVFLTPDLKPFFAGTYFPPYDRQGRPGFSTVLQSLADAWQNRRQEVEEQAEEVARALRSYLEERVAPVAATLAGPDVVARVLTGLEANFDAQWGGFGSAPKFPTPSNLFLLLEVADKNPVAEQMLTVTLDQMARGGIYDQLAGGFHRYATDREWKVPHFEKMLYDNGLLLEIYAREWRRSGSPEAARIARQTARFLEREMTASEGALWSAIDAETDGHEGLYYVWSREELLEVLGDEGFGFLAPLLGFQGSPFFEQGTYVLHLSQPLARLAERRQLEPDELMGEMTPLMATLLERRNTRQRPLTDDKILTDWNGMAIAGLATAGQLLDEPKFIAQAAAAAEFILDQLRDDQGLLLHSWRQGHGRIPAFLGDYVFLTRGLLGLHRATGEESWLDHAVDITRQQQERLGDPEGGFFTAAASDDVLFRTKEIFDGALPGTNAVAALNLLQLAERTGDESWLAVAGKTLRGFSSMIDSHPDGVKTMAVAVRRLHLGEPVPADKSWSSEPAGEEGVLTADLDLQPANEDGWRPFSLSLRLAPGWHVYANDEASPHTRPTRVVGRGVELDSLEYPTGEDLPLAEGSDTVRGYLGEIAIRGALRSTGEPEGALVVEYQPCDDTRCLAPAELELSLSDL